ncbi:MAG: hypothetical protein AAGJ82_04110 [Bacteroidota bacterium]
MEHTSRIVPTVARRCLQWGACLALTARAWLIYRWGSPIRSLVWDESVFQPVVEAFGWTWSEWVTSAVVDQALTQGETITAGLLFGAGIGVWGVYSIRAWLARSSRWLVQSGGVLLLLITLLAWKSHFFQWAYLLEMSLQWMAPFLVVALVQGRYIAWSILRWAIVFTFIGHGLYALGVYSVPGHFIEMTNNGLGLNTSQARWFLRTVGTLDVLAAVGLFFTNKRIVNWSCYYLIAWGALTALARLWSHQYGFSIHLLLTQWTPEVLVRFIHFLGPLAYWVWRNRR